MSPTRERRRFERYELPAMYTRLSVRTLDADEFQWDGHAYDISRGGVRFELDRGFEPGTPVAIRLDLPRAPAERRTEPRSVFAFANIVWIDDDDDAGPARMAAVFTRFARPRDEELLRKRILCGRYALAA
ncbi:MAG: PilZ domain-containing protein [Planctomycetota bacterium]|nr:MAG: PilZ domain-containing protein [Planctomycetota bacterium]